MKLCSTAKSTNATFVAESMRPGFLKERVIRGVKAAIVRPDSTDSGPAHDAETYLTPAWAIQHGTGGDKSVRTSTCLIRSPPSGDDGSQAATSGIDRRAKQSRSAGALGKRRTRARRRRRRSLERRESRIRSARLGRCDRRAWRRWPDDPRGELLPGDSALGINFGNVGFLALIERRDWQRAIDALLAGRLRGAAGVNAPGDAGAGGT